MTTKATATRKSRSVLMRKVQLFLESVGVCVTPQSHQQFVALIAAITAAIEAYMKAGTK